MRERHPRRRAFAALTGLVLVGALLAGCGLRIPSDPDGSLDRIDGATLHAGASLSDGLVHERPDGTPAGPLVDLVETFADEQDATVEWTIDSEEVLVGMLESHELDVVVGGMTDRTPWTDRAGVTRGYPGIDGSAGRPLVMLVPLGENRLLSSLEAFLDHALEQPDALERKAGS